MPELLKQFKLYDQAFTQKINLLKTIPFLFLDDLGAENMTKFFRNDVFYTVLHYRQEKNLTTFFSSNYNMKQLIQHFSIDKDDTQKDFYAYKIAHKLKKLCNFIEFKETKKEKNYLNKGF